jgi:ABC-2 type transport system permease protein
MISVDSARRYFSVAGGLGWRLLRSLISNPLLLLPPLLMPIFFFTAFAGGLSAITDAPGFHYAPGYTTFIFMFVLCQAAAFGGVFSGFSIAADFQFGFGRRLLLATPHRTALLVGYWFVALIRAVITFGVVTIAGLVAGMNIAGSGIDLFGLYGLALIVNVVGLLFAAGVALRFRSLQATPLMQVPVFLFLFLAPVYVPRNLLAGWVHAVSGFDPATHVMEAGRDLLAGQATDYLATLGIMLALAAAVLVFALRGLRKAEAAG